MKKLRTQKQTEAALKNLKLTPSHKANLSEEQKKQSRKDAVDKFRKTEYGKKKIQEYRDKIKGLIHTKAVQLRNRLPRLGEEKIEASLIEAEIIKILGKLCIYCSKELTLDTFSCDHKISVYNKGLATLDNLEFQICKACNHCKGSFNSDIFIKLLNYADELGIKKELMTRLKVGNMIYKRG